MISVGRATELVAGALPKAEVSAVPLEDAWGRVLAAEVVAGRDDPALDISAMDGYAVKAGLSDRQPTTWSADGVAPAGKAPAVLNDPRWCIEIGTGAPLPCGANAVVPVEEVDVQGNTVTLSEGVSLAAGRHVRHRGSNYQKGAVLLSPGTTLSAVHMAVLAAEGVISVPVFRRLQAAVVSSGSELVDPGEAPQAHQIRGSNLPALVAELQAAGFCLSGSAQVADDRSRLRGVIASLAEKSDVLVLTGGASRGRYDLVSGVLEELGADTLFHWVAQKPGKPLLAARLRSQSRSVLILGLPGNPQAALIDARRYLIEALYLQQCRGHRVLHYPLSEAVTTRPGRTAFLPVSLENGPEGAQLRPVKSSGSGDYFGLSRSTGFAQLPSEAECVPRRRLIPYYAWGHR